MGEIIESRRLILEIKSWSAVDNQDGMLGRVDVKKPLHRIARGCFCARRLQGEIDTG